MSRQTPNRLEYVSSAVDNHHSGTPLVIPAQNSERGERMSKWQPIETAPRDGTPLLLFVPEAAEGYRRCVGHFSVTEHLSHGKTTYKHEYWSVGGFVFGESPIPTHWQPLPDPPEIK